MSLPNVQQWWPARIVLLVSVVRCPVLLLAWRLRCVPECKQTCTLASIVCVCVFIVVFMFNSASSFVSMFLLHCSRVFFFSLFALLAFLPGVSFIVALLCCLALSVSWCSSWHFVSGIFVLTWCFCRYRPCIAICLVFSILQFGLHNLCLGVYVVGVFDLACSPSCPYSLFPHLLIGVSAFLFTFPFTRVSFRIVRALPCNP